jgi:hypothetical protein
LNAEPVSSHTAAELRQAASSLEGQPTRRQGILETELPGTVVINFAIVDAVCHAWDLGASVGVPIEFPPEMIPTIELVVAATCTDAARDHDLIKPVPLTPADATATEHLMALAGRAIPR